MAYSEASKQGLVPVSRKIDVVDTSKEFDLDSGLSLQHLIKNIELNLNSPRPSQCFFIWSGNRQNAKQELDIQQQNLVIQQIRNLGIAANEIATTKANIFLIPATVRAIIENKANEIFLARQKFLVDIERLKDEIVSIAHDSERRQHENEALKMANLKLKAEVRKAEADAAIQEANARKIEELNKVLEYIRLNKMEEFESELSAWVLACQAGDPSTFSDFSAGDILRQFMQRKKEAETIKEENAAKMSEQEVLRLKKEIENLEINLAAKRKKFNG